MTHTNLHNPQIVNHFSRFGTRNSQIVILNKDCSFKINIH